MSILVHPWQQYEVAPNRTHHLFQGKQVYSSRFSRVLKYHAPGLAPVKDQSGAYHININGEGVYPERYLDTFGFYEARAAVHSERGWWHILPNGESLYREKYAWCGNFQGGFCPVRNEEGSYFHIDTAGQRTYLEVYCYVGDFREGFAVIQNDRGLHTHIDKRGRYVHGCFFLDLDVFHKGYARAKDRNGWFHIKCNGESLYPDRFKNIEPFYNGLARVETHEEALLLIDETGKCVHLLRPVAEGPH